MNDNQNGRNDFLVALMAMWLILWGAAAMIAPFAIIKLCWQYLF